MIAYLNQIVTLGERGIEKNKRFLQTMWAEQQFLGAHRWFDKKGVPDTIRRVPDPEMTIERFLVLPWGEPMIRLQIASPDPDRIRYVVRTGQQNVNHFAWLEMPYTLENLARTEQHYQDTFGTALRDEPIAPGLVDYYHWRRTNYANF